MSEHRSARQRSTRAIRGVALTIVGWLLVLAGVAAIFLPGPGLLMLVGGLAVLANRYEWAERRLEPVKIRAFKAASDGV